MWYVIQTVGGQEQAVRRMIERQLSGAVIGQVEQCFIPMRERTVKRGGEWRLVQEKLFPGYVWTIHTGTTFIFGLTAILVVPFIKVYTAGISDANYVQPLFAALIVAANAGHCIRLPYNMIILAAGHYKQTQNNYIVVAIINILVSVATVKAWGLIGVAIGTLVAMTYQTVWMAVYDSKHLIQWPIKNFLKQVFVDIITVFIGYFSTRMITMQEVSYFAWMILALKTAAVWSLIAIAINTIFYRSKVLRIMNRFLRKRRCI